MLELYRLAETKKWDSKTSEIALVSLALRAVNFSLGALLGGDRFRQESSQSLGQKNNAFVIWVALTFLNPLVALGPTFYILYHNIYNSWQIYRFEKRRGQSLNVGKETHKEVSTDV